MFNINLISEKSIAEQIRTNALFEIHRLNKRKDFIQSSSASSSQTLAERQANLQKNQAELVHLNAQLATLPDGKEKSKLQVNIKEYEWKVSKLSLYTSNEDSVAELVQEAFEIEKINVTVALYNTFVAALDEKIAQL